MVMNLIPLYNGIYKNHPPGFILTPSALLRAASDCLAVESFLAAAAASDFLYAPANKDLPILSSGFEEVFASD
jgi:hypothetical protein